ncbi:MAG: flagellar biosynthetic protein FliR [Pirellulales bacterium]
MRWLEQLYALEPFARQYLVAGMLVLARVTGLVMSAPILGMQEAPMRIRGLFALALTLLVLPSQWNTPVENPKTLFDMSVLIGQEALVGLALGLGLMVLLGGIQVAGQLIGQISGMSLAEIFNPAFEDNVPFFSQLLFLVTVAVFLGIGGHRQIVSALMDTFVAVPLATGGLGDSIAHTMTTLVAQSFTLGVRAAAPVVTALLLATIVMGLLSRTLPQLNLMVLGFGINALVGIGATALTLGAMAWVFQGQVDVVLETITDGIANSGGVRD